MTAWRLGVSIAYTVLQASIALALWIRMRATGVTELKFLFLAFVIAAAAGVLGVAWSGFRILLNPLVAILVLPFVQATFHRDRRSPYRILLVACLLLYTYSSVARVATQVLSPPPDPSFLYTSYLVDILIVQMLCFGWFLVECVRAHRALTAGGSGIEPWVKARYVVLCISCGLAIMTAIPPILHETQASFQAEGTWMLVMAVTNLLFSLATLLAWFMPGWFKALVNTRAGARPSLVLAGGTVLAGDKIAGTLLFSIIDHLGNVLAPRIGKSPSAAKGLLLVSIESVERARDETGIDLSLVEFAIDHEVRRRLEATATHGLNAIVADLLDALHAIRSLPVMSKV